MALVFRCHVTEGTPKTSAEAVAVKWMTPADIRWHMEEAYAVRMLDALDAGRPSVRSHDGQALVTR